ncbi:MAG: adenine nucleotide alpha hydrolase family protein [Euryarchaeota archaeon]|nr:adenine nucleotide alpha hydrolase family protein [Euryarchaeota archaeon]
MRCSRCREQAVINLRAHRLALCEEHFVERFLEVVERAIRRYSLMRRSSRVLVAVSGGKDSLALWDALTELGYRADGLYIDLGIRRQDYSRISREKAERFAEQRGLELRVFSVQEEYGLSMPELRRGSREVCSVCGIVKRHVMNRVALEGGYHVLATGHNLDDEASVLLSNLLRWNTELAARQAPRVEAWHEKLRPKVKPLCLLTEKETATYALVRGIDYVSELECPFSAGATSIALKEALNRIEEHSPGTKLYFYTQFLKHRRIFRSEKPAKRECRSCGFPSAGELCSFCRLLLKSRLRGEKRDN